MGQQISFDGAGITYVQDPQDNVLFDKVNNISVAGWSKQSWILPGFPANVTINETTGALGGPVGQVENN